MPKSWYDWRSAKQIEDQEKRNLYFSILADKKPYFMRYIYPELKRKYETYISKAERNCLRNFGLTIEELKSLPYRDLTQAQSTFLNIYQKKMPVSDGDSVMNKICRRFEDQFDGHISKYNSTHTFDYRILKSGVDYSQSVYNSVLHVYRDFLKKSQNFVVFADYERLDSDKVADEVIAMRNDFRRRCYEICNNEIVLADILLDMCYTKSNSKRFVWEMCGDQIVENLLRKNNNTISFPTLYEKGEIEYCGDRFTIKNKEMEVKDDDYS